MSDFKHQLALSDYSNGLAVDLKGYEPEIEDDAEKKHLRFNVYYEKMLNHMELNTKGRSPGGSLPTIDSIGNDEDIKRALRGWAGQ